MSPIGDTYLTQVLFFLLGASILMMGKYLEKKRQVELQRARARPHSQRNKARRPSSNSPVSFLLLLTGGALTATSAVVMVFKISMG